ncbi:elongation of very long chain fatty acids protein 7-like isoform X1 [Stomoxys calcitrans]|uniref:elongation of very long chain fatty acids protein 7-like isoform X1 n=1 Tax=Stomoxys calcitrans TaxID=35570 RepID=UPI0027E260B5|nr:elongation of very long chain fatty acids protein 7-like isoform X1 [Stomoxys calcitrans]
MKVLRLTVIPILDAVNTFRLDKRVSTHPVWGSPWCMIIGVILYLLVVKKWGPRFMANRKPYKIENIMMAYNCIQIIINLYIFCVSLRYSFLRSDFSWTCEPYNPNDMRPETLKLGHAGRLYLFTKYLDLLDTIFFLMRKKYNQITFLHLYHHSLVLVMVHVYCSKYFASHLTSTGVLNSFVHAVMYFYYQLSAMKLNINLQPWKRVMTNMQMLQFFLLSVHFCLPLINNSCNFDLAFLTLTFLQNVFVTILFGNFYYQSYIRKDRKSVNIKLSS